MVAAMKGATILAAVLLALLCLHFGPVHVVSCNGHDCQLSDGSFRLDPRNHERFYP